MRIPHGGRAPPGSIGGHITPGRTIPQVRSSSPPGNAAPRQLVDHSGLVGSALLLEEGTTDPAVVVLLVATSAALSPIVDILQEQMDVIMPQVRLVHEDIHMPQVRLNEERPQVRLCRRLVPDPVELPGIRG
eukprot:692356-Amphidinium_carterae.1